MQYFTPYFASTYGQNAYGTSTYQNGTVNTSTGSGSSGSGSPLANTGFDLILAATLGSVIIFTALLVRFFKRPSKKPNATRAE